MVNWTIVAAKCHIPTVSNVVDGLGGKRTSCKFGHTTKSIQALLGVEERALIL